ncbi:MAG: pantetheine-phosphate adenylyltransferase [Burkholderiales bacterium]|jgi:pantetheine-phosphate adenylyltransferase|nr:pantetheine-phosphate adenylyltransferase [Burkholderiales bacterium]
MSKPVIAVYPGTFDPITLGHEDLIRRAASLFGTVIVAVAVAHHKKTMFSLDERLDSVREVVKAYANVRVESFTGLVRDFAVDHGATAMLRGVRSVTDFDYESQLAGMNRALAPDVDTVFLTPDSRYQFISSTLVREIATLNGDVAQFVAPTVHARLLQKLSPQ